MDTFKRTHVCSGRFYGCCCTGNCKAKQRSLIINVIRKHICQSGDHCITGTLEAFDLNRRYSGFPCTFRAYKYRTFFTERNDGVLDTMYF